MVNKPFYILLWWKKYGMIEGAKLEGSLPKTEAMQCLRERGSTIWLEPLSVLNWLKWSRRRSDDRIQLFLLCYFVNRLIIQRALKPNSWKIFTSTLEKFPLSSIYTTRENPGLLRRSQFLGKIKHLKFFQKISWTHSFYWKLHNVKLYHYWMA